MALKRIGELKYYYFESLVGIKHAIFTRHGGISPEPWDSLNTGGTVGDNVENVRINIERSFSTFELDVQFKFDAWQVHGANAVFVERPRRQDEHPMKADIILTNNRNVVLFMRFADCVPIMLFDPVQQVVGIAHAGWMGTVKRVASVAVRKMAEHYGSKPSDILAGIGPSIGPNSYEVGMDVVKKVRNTFKSTADRILNWKAKGAHNKAYLNLWEANRLQLERAGVKIIELAAIDTASNTHDWYSHRAEKGKTGRFGALITLI